MATRNIKTFNLINIIRLNKNFLNDKLISDEFENNISKITSDMEISRERAIAHSNMIFKNYIR